MKSGSSKSYGLLALFLITGAVLGGILGEIISNSSIMTGIAPFMVKTYPIFDIPPITINLYVVKLVLGLALYPNLISIIGIIAAVLLFRRF